MFGYGANNPFQRLREPGEFPISYNNLATPLGMAQNYANEQSYNIGADNFRRRAQETDKMLSMPGYSRFGHFDTMQQRNADMARAQSFDQAAQQERAKTFFQQQLMRPYAGQIAENTRAQALGYRNAAEQNELANTREARAALLNAFMSGLGELFTPFANTGSSDAGNILAGLLGNTSGGTTIDMRNSNMEPIGRVVSQVGQAVRPAINRYMGAA